VILVAWTLSAHWFDLVGTLGWYTPIKWWKLEKFRFILVIFEVHQTGNTAQLGFCGGYEFSQVFPTPLCYWFALRTTLESYALRENDKRSRKYTKYYFTDLYFFWLFFCAFSQTLFSFSNLYFFERIFFADNRGFRTCTLSNAYFFQTIEIRRKNKFGKKYKPKKRYLQVWKEFWNLKKKLKSKKNVSPWKNDNKSQIGEERNVLRKKKWNRILKTKVSKVKEKPKSQGTLQRVSIAL